MTNQYRKPLAGTQLEYYDVRQAVEDIQPGAYETLPYTSKVLAEQLVRKADAENLTDYLKQLIERRQGMDFPWYPARVVCHDILGQTALVDLAGLRDAIAEKGGVSKSDAGKALDATIASITEALKKGGTVTLVGFGTFSVKERAARTGRNPKTGEELQIKASKVPSFKPGKGLKDSVA